ncbi:YacL family protein [Sodalis sp.]|uniref:YacL family protein n=1 Tax=Sodalis sp. (in: enterobacteria) TaxID=1898979 RepID=UPI0038738899
MQACSGHGENAHNPIIFHQHFPQRYSIDSNGVVDGNNEPRILRDATGQIIVKFSVGHEAIWHWLNDEVKGDRRY